MSADRPVTEPRTEAGYQLLGWHDAGHVAFISDDENVAMDRDEVLRYILAIEAEAAQGAAPRQQTRVEGLERRLLSAIFGSEEFHQKADVNIETDPCAGCRWWTRFRAGTLYEGTGEPSRRPSDERVPESEESR